MLPDFLILALIGGITIAITAGSLGSFIVWRKMAFFGDTLAHASLLGIAIGLLFNIHLTFTVITVCFLVAIALVYMQQQQLAVDTLLGILSHSLLALGLLLISMSDSINIDINSYLFGDLLTLNTEEVITIIIIATIASTLLLKNWSSFIAITINEDLAQVDGINVKRQKILLMLIIAMVIGVALRAVGVLLLTALLIIPSASARLVSSTPEKMVLLSILFAVLSVISGLVFSFYFDLPVGSVIVVNVTFLYIVCLISSKNFNLHHH